MTYLLTCCHCYPSRCTVYDQRLSTWHLLLLGCSSLGPDGQQKHVNFAPVVIGLFKPWAWRTIELCAQYSLWKLCDCATVCKGHVLACAAAINRNMASLSVFHDQDMFKNEYRISNSKSFEMLRISQYHYHHISLPVDLWSIVTDKLPPIRSVMGKPSEFITGSFITFLIQILLDYYFCGTSITLFMNWNNMKVSAYLNDAELLFMLSSIMKMLKWQCKQNQELTLPK